ncbi:MAG: glycosyltransferase family 1 protein [Myxococcales bacterium]|nr:MAG: glycosyltransferase family 1 protein [Myxococcales bacterium]
MGQRILVLNERDPENPLAGGAEVHTFEVFGRLAARGHEVTLLAASVPGLAPIAQIDGIHVHRLVNRYAYYGVVPLVARRMIRERGFDVVVDVLAKIPFLSPWFQRIPCLAMVHHLFGTTAFQQVPFPVALVTYLSEKLIPPCYRHSPVVVVSPSTEQDMIERGLPRCNMSIIPNAVDHDRYSPGTEAKPDVPTVAWLGRVEPYKRLDIFLRALVQVRKTVPDVRSVIIGDGTGLDAAKALAVRLGLEDSVEFCGFVGIDRKVELLRRAHMLVNTSEKEGWGLTVLEGNACGTITVASDVPGLRDSVRDGVTGVLVEHGNVEQLAAEMMRLLENRDTLAALEVNAVAWADRFRWDAVTDAMETVVDAVAAGADPSDIRMISPVFCD